MTLTHEHIAKSREEFKEEFKDWRGFLAEDAEGKFINKYTQRMWIGWVRRQESLVVELPFGHSMQDPDGHGTGIYYDSELVKIRMQSAGINYRENE